jgi:hypothetical protein
MANPKKGKSDSILNFLKKPKKKRAGVHSKKKNSSHKNSKHYKKKPVGQGK